MRAFIVLAVLPVLALANVGSFVKISAHGHSHEYNHGELATHTGHHVPHPAPAHPHPAPAPYHPAPAPVYHPKPAPAPYHPAPAPYHPAPVHHAPVHHAPAYGHPHHGYGYEEPKDNCTVVDVTETAEVCTPAFETVCADVEILTKIIVDKEQCDTITRTVCTESIEIIPQEICTYKYQQKTEDTVATTVEVTFAKKENVQMVTVCAPGHSGYGHGGYGGYGGYGKYCKEVAQTTQYNVPVVTPIDLPVVVAYPEPIKVCVDKPISLPRVTCEDIVSTKCITVPEVEDLVVAVEKCDAQLAAPTCIDVELTLPKQVCVELVYGYAHE